MTSRLAVFCWHNVHGTWSFPSAPGAGERGLSRQLRALQRGASVLPLGEALRRLREGEPLPPRAAAITFDDGYRDSLDVAAPLLDRLGLPATFFLVPGLLAREVRPWWEVLAWAFARASRSQVRWEGHELTADASAGRGVAEQLKRRDRAAREEAVETLVALLEPTGDPGDRELFLDWDGARSLVRSGFEVGSHTVAHAILAEQRAQEQSEDLAEARARLAGKLGVAVDLLAYPNGTPRDYSLDTLAAAEAAGHAAALTTVPGLNRRSTPRFEARRYVMYPEQDVLAYAKIVKHAAGQLVRR